MNQVPVVVPQSLDGPGLPVRRGVQGGRYPRSFRRDVARLIVEGQTDLERMSVLLGVKTNTLRRWLQEDRVARARASTAHLSFVLALHGP